ncbi:hypothetical protein [Tellurirhabdus rosea]|uniref:hypothetical protein n=1 Tax=Tellurirhabdus rosea TaxID=2674997 RepID=UPI0022527C28|nr:hypothetical protein [Tellurirhabdus rosea]
MKNSLLVLVSLALGTLPRLTQAQDASSLSPRRPALPVHVSVFSHSVSLPDFRGFFRNPNLGVRLGTELYYTNRPGKQVFQTVNVGLYRQKSLHNAFFVSSEFGYRRFIGHVFADATVGGGYLHLRSIPPVYAPVGPGEFTKTSPVRHKFMPTLGLGAGYRFNRTSLFARYEIFGLMPIQQDVPLLPHKALHLGARLNFSR